MQWAIDQGHHAGALEALKAHGLRIVMLTGDSRDRGSRRTDLRIDEVIAEVQPADKQRSWRASDEGKRVAMVGDGINDAPRSRRRMSASRWARAPTSRWKART